MTIGGNGRGEVFLNGGSLNSTPILLSAIGENMEVKVETCEIGGYEPYINNTTDRWPGNGELVVSNATLYLTGSASTDTAAQLYIGRSFSWCGDGRTRGYPMNTSWKTLAPMASMSSAVRGRTTGLPSTSSGWNLCVFSL